MKHDLIIGKYTLESITNGMYASPLDFYREYIQNAVDSIDDAISNALEPNEEYEEPLEEDEDDFEVPLDELEFPGDDEVEEDL